MAGAALLPLAAVAVEVDGVAARVGSAVILKSDVIGEMRRGGMDESRYGEVRNEMIERELILKAAIDSKMTLQDWMVENRIREIIARAFDGDRNKLMETLAKQKVSYPEWYKRMKEDMMVSAMRWQIVDKNVVASPGKMKAEYEADPKRFASSHKVTVSAILLGPDSAEKRKKVDEGLKTESFADLARLYSEDARAKEGGQWKDIDPSEVFRPEICTELAGMPVGTISKWIELDGWSFLLRKDAESGGALRTLAEAHDDVAAAVRAKEAKRLYGEWIERLKKNAYIKVY